MLVDTKITSVCPLRIGINYLIDSSTTMLVEGVGNLTFSPSSPLTILLSAFILVNGYKIHFNISGKGLFGHPNVHP